MFSQTGYSGRQTSGRVQSVKRTTVRRLVANARHAFDPLGRAFRDATSSSGDDPSENSKPMKSTFQRLVKKKLQRVSGYGSTHQSSNGSGFKRYQEQAQIRKAIVAALEKGETVQIPQVVMPSAGTVNTITRDDGTTAPGDETRPSTPEPEPDKHHVDGLIAPLNADPSQDKESPSTVVGPASNTDNLPSTSSAGVAPTRSELVKDERQPEGSSPQTNDISPAVGAVKETKSNTDGHSDGKLELSVLKQVVLKNQTDSPRPDSELSYYLVSTYDAPQERPAASQNVHSLPTIVSTQSTQPLATNNLAQANFQTTDDGNVFDTSLGSLHPPNYDPYCETPTVPQPVYSQSTCNYMDFLVDDDQPMQDIQPSYNHLSSNSIHIPGVPDMSNLLGHNQIHPQAEGVASNGVQHYSTFPAQLGQEYSSWSNHPQAPACTPSPYFLPQLSSQFCSSGDPAHFQHQTPFSSPSFPPQLPSHFDGSAAYSLHAQHPPFFPQSYMGSQREPLQYTMDQSQGERPEDQAFTIQDAAEMFRRPRSEAPCAVPRSISLCAQSEWMENRPKLVTEASVNTSRLIFANNGLEYSSHRWDQTGEGCNKQKPRRSSVYKLVDPDEFHHFYPESKEGDPMFNNGLADPMVEDSGWPVVFPGGYYMDDSEGMEDIEYTDEDASSSCSEMNCHEIAGWPPSYSEDYDMEDDDFSPSIDSDLYPAENRTFPLPNAPTTEQTVALTTGLWAWFATALWALWTLLVSETCSVRSPGRNR